ncbi:MAG: RNA polymerase sigma-70 factor [Tannerella sp.]|jgi:RNA polymerase sigma-70 factor (ECF subfamily)|nr:RNA polymerase sigma-70 factor [Tannerella sp.]
MDDERKHINLVKEGSASSFKYLYNVWSGKLYNFVMRISKGEEYLAEEIVQMTFIKVWENRQSLDPDQSFSAYLRTIAKNLLTNIYEHRMQEYIYQENASRMPASENTTEEDVNYHLLDEYIDTLTEQLPPARKEIFILSRRKFLSNREIALKLNLSENTVESQLTKATAFFHKKFDKNYKK